MTLRISSAARFSKSANTQHQASHIIQRCLFTPECCANLTTLWVDFWPQQTSIGVPEIVFFMLYCRSQNCAIALQEALLLFQKSNSHPSEKPFNIHMCRSHLSVAPLKEFHLWEHGTWCSKNIWNMYHDPSVPLPLVTASGRSSPTCHHFFL